MLGISLESGTASLPDIYPPPCHTPSVSLHPLLLPTHCLLAAIRREACSTSASSLLLLVLPVLVYQCSQPCSTSVPSLALPGLPALLYQCSQPWSISASSLGLPVLPAYELCLSTTHCDKTHWNHEPTPTFSLLTSPSPQVLSRWQKADLWNGLAQHWSGTQNPFFIPEQESLFALWEYWMCLRNMISCSPTVSKLITPKAPTLFNLHYFYFRKNFLLKQSTLDIPLNWLHLV